MKFPRLRRALSVSFHLIHVLVCVGFFLVFLGVASWAMSLWFSLGSLPLDSIFYWGVAVAAGLVLTVAPLASAVEQLAQTLRGEEEPEGAQEPLTQDVEPSCPTP